MVTTIDKQIEISDIALKQMNAVQLQALQNLIPGWKDCEFIVRMNFGCLEVQVMKNEKMVIFIGIEEDGYTHS